MMVRRGPFFVRLILALLFLTGLVAGGVALYQTGQAQGYALGLATGAEGVEIPPPVAHFYPGYYPRPFLFPFFGLLCWGGMALFGFLILSRLFFFRSHSWRHAGPHPWGEGPPWGKHKSGSGSEAGKPENPAGETPQEGSEG